MGQLIELATRRGVRQATATPTRRVPSAADVIAEVFALIAMAGDLSLADKVSLVPALAAALQPAPPRRGGGECR
jgi:hypothetical protein